MDQDKFVLEVLLKMMPFLGQAFEDIVITLSDTEKYIYYKAGTKLDHGIKVGDPVKEGSMTDIAYKNNGFVMANIGSEVFGVPYSAFGFPIFNLNNKLIGGMVFCESVEMKENQNLLKDISEEISKNMEMMGNNIDSLVNQSEYINSTTKNLLTQAHESENQLQETNNILNIIKSVSSKINMLGISAMIESTGTKKDNQEAVFNLVIDEIKELSQKTDNAINKLEPIIKQIHLNGENMTSKITELNSRRESINSFINQTREMADKLSATSKLIENMSNNLVKSTKQK